MIAIQSSIQTSLKQFVLFRGTILAGMGAFLILFGGVVLPRDVLAYWGVFIVAMAFGLITLGLLPYRRLSRLETSPHELVLTDTSLLYFMKGKKILDIPRSSIQHVAFCAKARRYGVGIWLKNPLPDKVCVSDNFKVNFYQFRARHQFGCDLFLPYFSEKSLRMTILYLTKSSFHEI